MGSNRQWVLGGILIGFGILLLLKNFGITDIGIGYVISKYWPVLLVLLGLDFVFKKRGKVELITGLFLIILGALLLGEKHGLYKLDLSMLWKIFWPLVIILLGISFLRGPKPIGKSNFAFMGGFERKKEKWVLEDGSYWAVMGGIELDLRKAVIEDREYQINCNAIMGGIDIVVPTDITVICEGTAILGGVDLLGEGTGGIVSSLKAEQIKEGNKAVKIYCRAIMGGVEVKVKE